MKPRYRQYKPTDHDTCKRIWQENSQYVEALHNRKALERTRRKNPRLFWVAEENGEVVGAAFASFDGRMAHVQALSVTKAKQGKGIGTALLKRIEGNAKGAVGMYCVTDRKRKKTIKFYERNGYEAVPELVYLLKKRN